MKRWLMALSFSIALAFNIGCASIYSLSSSPDDVRRNIKHTREVYGGVQFDYGLIAHSKERFGGPVVRPCMSAVKDTFRVIDLPLSAVVDTLALPYTIPYNSDSNKGDEKTEPTAGASGIPAAQP